MCCAALCSAELSWAVIRCGVVCHAVLCRTTGMLCSAMLLCAALRWRCWVMLLCAELCWVVILGVVCCDELCCAVIWSPRTMLHCAVLCHGTLQDLVNSFVWCRRTLDVSQTSSNAHGLHNDNLSLKHLHCWATSLWQISENEERREKKQQYYLTLKLDFSRRIIKAKPFSHQKKTTVIWKDMCQRSTLTQKTRYSVIHHPNWAKPS